MEFFLENPTKLVEVIDTPHKLLALIVLTAGVLAIVMTRGLPSLYRAGVFVLMFCVTVWVVWTGAQSGINGLADTPSPTVDSRTEVPRSSVGGSTPAKTGGDPAANAKSGIAGQTGAGDLSDGFIFNDSHKRLLTEEEVLALTEWEKWIARNEIYARNGRDFVSEDLREHFKQFDWYEAKTWHPQLNKIELSNVFLIQKTRKMSVDVASKPSTIVILGAAVWEGGVPSPTLMRRSGFAAELYFDGHFDRVIPSGGLGRHPPSEAAVMRDILVAKGIPEDRIILDESAKTTIDTARFLGEWIRTHPDWRIEVVTDGYHALRTRIALGAYGVRAKVRAVRATEPSPRPVLLIKQWLRELLAIPYYLLIFAGVRLKGA